MIEAFQVGTEPPYAEKNHGPCPCPSWVQCGAVACDNDGDCPRLCEDGTTSCTSDQDCIIAGLIDCGPAICLDGACTDECGRCKPLP